MTAFGVEPYGQPKYLEIAGKRMAYIDEGKGDAIVFQHGNPTSSYLWRNIMPHLEGLGRLVACDLIGMGASDKLSPSGPDRYSYGEQRDFLFALWDALDLGDHVVLVLHDWGSALGFDWANQHRDRVQGIAFMEAIVTPMTWADWPPAVRGVFQGFRSPQGEPMALEHNIFVERVLPGAILRQLSDEEMNHYRRPFVNGGEDRRPTLSWPRNLPIDGEPAEVVALVNEYRSWLEETDMPKLFINAEPGAIITGRIRDYELAQPDRNHSARRAFRSGGQPRGNRCGHSTVRPAAPVGGRRLTATGPHARPPATDGLPARAAPKASAARGGRLVKRQPYQPRHHVVQRVKHLQDLFSATRNPCLKRMTPTDKNGRLEALRPRWRK